MITINLSDKDARELLNAVGWREPIPASIETEMFIQLEQQLTPRSTGAAELAVWRHEQGLTEMDVEKWKRKNGKIYDSMEKVIHDLEVNGL